MTTFNAGSIEATLDLDLDPFQRGLAEARGLGQDFGREKFTAKLDVDTSSVTRKAATAKRRLEDAAGRYTATFEARGLGEAAAEAAGLKTALNAVDGRHRIDVDTTGAQASIGGVRRGIRALIPLLAIAATGLVPLSAAAVPALGLLNNLTLTAAAAGSLILAFQGMGGALEAVNKAQLEPTAENLAAAEAALDGLTPAAGAFVVQLEAMSDVAGDLQKAAANGFFPGAVLALERAETLLPRFNPLVQELASSLGIVADNTVRGLGSDQWMDFYDFAQREARPAVDGLAQSLGNLAGGLAGMWEGFDPLNDDFTEWLINITQRFEDWGQTLDENRGMQDFIGYVREVGPEAGETLQALGAGFSALVQASAPLGGVVLEVLEDIGNIVEFIAEQPFGDELLLGAAAIYSVNKALKITEGLLTRIGITGGAAAGSGIAAGFTTMTGKAQTFGGALRALPRDLATLATTSRTAGARTERELNRVAAASDRARVAMRGLARGGAAIAALGVLGTEAGQGIGVTNSAMLGLAGYMIGGPWGAAAGAGAGYIMDIKAASDDVTDSIEGWNQALSDNVARFSEHQGILSRAKADVEALQRDIDNPTFLSSLFGAFDPDEWANAWAGLTTGETNTSRMEREYAELEEQMQATDMTARGLADAFDYDITDVTGGIADAKFAELLERSGAAMQHFGVTYEELTNMPGIQRDALIGVFAAWTGELDSVGSRTDAFADTVANLGDVTLGTEQAASELGAALDALLSPTLNAEEATDAWRASLQELEAELKSGAGFKGFTEAAMQNRQLTRDYTRDSMARLEALAGVGTTTQKDMALAVRQTRREFIESGVAAGFDADQMRRRADALGLTPELVKTVFEAAGIERADLRARQLKETYKSLPDKVQSEIRANGIPSTTGQINALVKRYELTEKQREALVTLKDLASKDIGDVLAKLGILDRTNPNPAVNLQTGNALGTLQSIYQSLTNLDGKTAQTYIKTTRLPVEGRPGPQVTMATGGPVTGPGTGTSDSIPAWLSNGEHVWTAREVASAGGHAAVEAMRAQFRYATGGPVAVTAPRRITAPSSAATLQRTPTGITGDDIERLIEAIRANRNIYAQVSSREDLETTFRALESELRRG